MLQRKSVWKQGADLLETSALTIASYIVFFTHRSLTTAVWFAKLCFWSDLYQLFSSLQHLVLILYRDYYGDLIFLFFFKWRGRLLLTVQMWICLVEERGLGTPIAHPGAVCLLWAAEYRRVPALLCYLQFSRLGPSNSRASYYLHFSVTDC